MARRRMSPPLAPPLRRLLVVLHVGERDLRPALLLVAQVEGAGRPTLAARA